VKLGAMMAQRAEAGGRVVQIGKSLGDQVGCRGIDDFGSRYIFQRR